MYREHVSLEDVPKKLFNISYEENNEYKILTSYRLIKVSRAFYEIWLSVNGEKSIDAIINDYLKNNNAGNYDKTQIEENVLKFIKYLDDQKVIVLNWKAFNET